ncbi:MAG: hypothetical protein KJ622_17180 [Alphaproteobacteria bacterium]|nr:hypothetical protein [Alphaproteobacteria bacterium]
MSTAQYIAGLIGPLFMAIAAFMALRRAAFAEFAQMAIRDKPLILFAGVVLLVAGTAILQSHNLWVGDWRILITLIGWLGVIGGLIRIFAPEFATSVVEHIKPDHPAVMVTAVIYFALGAFLFGKAHALI